MMLRTIKTVLVLGLLLAVSAASHLYAEVKVSSLFSDGCVLQQGQVVPVWGWANAGDKVTVSFAGQTEKVTAPEGGKWMVRLAALKASAQGAELTIQVNAEKKVIKDVLVGEVWLCSGQSNMDFTLTKLAVKTRDPKHQPLADYVANEIRTAKDPLLRQITVPRRVSAKEPLPNFEGHWFKCDPATNGEFTGTGYFFARELRKHLKVPVGLVKSPWGGTRVEPWIPVSGFKKQADLLAYYEAEHKTLDEQLAKWDPEKVKASYAKRLEKWKETVKAAKKNKKKAPRRPRMPTEPSKSNRVPSTLYNGMIHSVVPYAIKGAIWYQGESNAGHFPEAYSQRFMQMISSWREVWGQGDFPFYFCQLAQFKKPVDEPVGEDGWVTVINEQLKTLALKNTGMAVLNDVGEALDIHPRDKMSAGQRLSLWALAKDYGLMLPAYSGPLYKSHKISGGKITVSFSHIGSGLMVGKKPLMGTAKPAEGELKHFQICGKDKLWVWAKAKIVGDTVEIWHDDIKSPVAARYAWAANAEGANLYNKQGLPASCFKTD